MIFCRRKIDSNSQPFDLQILNICEGPPHAVGPASTLLGFVCCGCILLCVLGIGFWLEMLGSGTNLVTTVIGFGMSATFIVFVCTRIICGRLRRGAESRMMYEIESRIDIEQPEHHVNDPESDPVLLDAIPTLKFNQEAFSSLEHTQCVICLADYKEREVLRIMPKCGHTFHLSCIDIWLRKQSTCPVCRLPLKNSSETKHVTVRPVTFTTNQSLDESHTSERNEDIERHAEPTPIAASNSLQPTSGEQEARQ
ncbi:hypothetical protein VNO78_15371 [Psophocarpus tetragonolobus]|uniref:RING-type domain-containing protein n=1 Tax=Psophocarpus tetragonolobus TaxID=3891 RepID=A0AAN9SEH6_PSOTE